MRRFVRSIFSGRRRYSVMVIWRSSASVGIASESHVAT